MDSTKKYADEVTAKVEVAFADLIKEQDGAIVNAANTRLSNVGGVARAIDDAAGPEFHDECIRIGAQKGVPTGTALIMKGYDLPAPYVIHTVGPVYTEVSEELAKKQLYDAHYSTFRVAAENNISSVSLPAISCGVYGYPVEAAAPIAIKATLDALEAFPTIEKVRFCFWKDPRAKEGAKEIFQKALDDLSKNPKTSDDKNPEANDVEPKHHESVLYSYLNDNDKSVIDDPEKVVGSPYPLSAEALAKLVSLGEGTEISADEIKDWYFGGLLPAEKSIGEPEFNQAAATVAFFLKNLPVHQRETIRNLASVEKDSSDGFLTALALITASKARVLQNQEDKEFFINLTRGLLQATDRI